MSYSPPKTSTMPGRSRVGCAITLPARLSPLWRPQWAAAVLKGPGPDRTAMTAARRRDRRTILCVDGQVGIRQMVRRGLGRERYPGMLARPRAAGLKLLLINPRRTHRTGE